MIQHALLPKALAWKYQGKQWKCEKKPEWELVEWLDRDPRPTDTELTQAITDYDALPPDDAAKDQNAARKKRFDALGNGLQDLKDFIRGELL